MDDNTRRQITWILLGAAGLSLIAYAVHQRNVVPSALRTLSQGTLTQQVAAVQVLVERGKVAEALADQPRWVQTAAVKALLEVGSPEAIQQLTEAVPVLDEPVGDWATSAITSLGRVVIGPLVECLQNKDDGIRGAAQGPLIAIGGQPVIDAVKPMMGAYDDYVRGAVVAVLSALGKPATPVAVQMLLRDMPFPDQSSAAFARAQDTALEILVATGEPALEPIITKLVPSPREKVRANAALMLGRMAATLGEETGRIVDPLLKLGHDSSWAVRRRVAWALGEVDDPAREGEIIQALTARLQDAYTEVKTEAVKALGRIGSPTAAPALVQVLLTNREGALEELVLALARMGPPALPALAPALQAPEAEARQLATQAVARIGTATAVPILASRLADSDVKVRRIAAQALVIEPVPAAEVEPDRVAAHQRQVQATVAVIDHLVAALADEDAQVYRPVSQTLAEISEPAISPLIARLGSGNPRTALMAEQALAAIGRQAVPPLLGALGSDTPQTRSWAAIALGDIGSPALPGLIALLKEEGAPLPARLAAAKALGRTRLPEAVRPLSEVASAASPDLRQAVLRALATTRQTEATASLVQGLNDPVTPVRLVALQLLKDWQFDDVDEQVTEVFNSGDETAKRLAAIVLSVHASPVSTPGLGMMLGQPAAAEGEQNIAAVLNEAATEAGIPQIQREAIMSLAYSGNRESLDVLGQFLQPGNPLAGRAAHSLGLLGGQVVAREGPESQLVQGAVRQLMKVFTETDNAHLRLQVSAALSLMQAAPVEALLPKLGEAEDYLKPWVAAVLGAIGKPANDAVMSEFGKDRASKEWAAVAVKLISNPQSLKFLERLPKSEQPAEEKVDQARDLYDAVMDERAKSVV